MNADTPDKLKKLAPDIRWSPPVLYPQNPLEAAKELVSLKSKCLDVRDCVIRGEFREAGIILLYVSPRTEVTGTVVVHDMLGKAVKAQQKNRVQVAGIVGEMGARAEKAEVAYGTLMAKLGETDIVIGQAMRGQLGAMTPSQILVLDDVKEAIDYFDEFLEIIAPPSKPKAKRFKLI